jgi:hypothetical protein
MREQHLCQLSSARVDTLGNNATIEQDQRQTAFALLGEGLPDDGIRHEISRLVRQIVPLDVNALRPDPLQVGREPGKNRIDTRAADTGRTTHRRIEHVKSQHDEDPLSDRFCRKPVPRAIAARADRQHHQHLHQNADDCRERGARTRTEQGHDRGNRELEDTAGVNPRARRYRAAGVSIGSGLKYLRWNHSETVTRLISTGTSTSGPMTAAKASPE